MELGKGWLPIIGAHWLSSFAAPLTVANINNNKIWKQ